MNMLSLCSGIGGFDLAAELTGAIRTVAFSEIDSFCCRVLAYHWPDIPNLGDIHGITRDSLRAAGVDPDGIDLIAGGIPCQPHSTAGKRRGGADERDLWPVTARLIREIKPRWVLVENVPGLRSSDAGRFFPGIHRDLAEMGYAAGWMVYGAADVGAPHKRDRVFITAHMADTSGIEESQLQGGRHPVQSGGELQHDTAGCGSALADTSSRQSQRRRRTGQLSGATVAPESEAQQWQRDGDATRSDCALMANAERSESRLRYDADIKRGWENPTKQTGLGGKRKSVVEHASSAGRYATGRFGTPRSNRQVEPRVGNHAHGVSSGVARYFDWRGWPAGPHEAQANWEPPRVITASEKDRAAKLKALGNSVVVLQAYLALQAIADTEDSGGGVCQNRLAHDVDGRQSRAGAVRCEKIHSRSK